MQGSTRLITVAIATIALLAKGVGFAAANPGISLSWNDCPSSPASLQALIAPCQNSAAEDLIVSFELAAPVDSVIALEAVVDVQAADVLLPPWWQYGPGACRGGKLLASASFPGLSACADFWQNAATFSGPPVYSTGAPRGGPNQARIVVTVGVLSSEARTLVAGNGYYAARLGFTNDPGAACPGCEVPVCLLLNSIRLVRIPGTVNGDVELYSAAEPNSNRATWQSASASCDAVPVRPTSWGRIKMLYR